MLDTPCVSRTHTAKIWNLDLFGSKTTHMRQNESWQDSLRKVVFKWGFIQSCFKRHQVGKSGVDVVSTWRSGTIKNSSKLNQSYTIVSIKFKKNQLKSLWGTNKKHWPEWQKSWILVLVLSLTHGKSFTHYLSFFGSHFLINRRKEPAPNHPKVSFQI